MRLSSPIWPCLLALDPSIAASLVASWDCKVAVPSASWDLTSLSNEKIVTHTRSSPPSEYVEEVRWNTCNELKEREGYDNADQCPAGTLACLTEINKKNKDGVDRITAVIPLAVASDLRPEVSSMQPPSKGLSLLLHGSSFPSSDPSSIRHSLNLTLLCNSSEESPKFVGFDRLRGVVDIEWSVPAACPSSKDGSHDDDGEKPPEKEDPPVPAAGGGLGWFFLM
ncbi:hypothetical protein M407DRAFT_135474 [Tulasnella calospora MUT 4182]|uniref:Uncharacterized protein n=1 Tax=Tulasnella calospora MUT 4182 TaxID=1051891 RepID=A0A0C3QRD5_9AGAM|nr:hypothetical protein M407DRAFT_135474 [Tulasnella calospora MUT 4182]